MPGSPYINVFRNIAHPILTANDVSKGLVRGAYESVVRDRPLRPACGHAGAQIFGGATARAVDAGDDTTGYGFLQGNNMIVQSAVTSLVSGGLDTLMNRGSRIERFAVPIVVDGLGDRMSPFLYSSNPRLL
jgi:hypothetical protein